jgi:hypothetical protein
MIKISQIFENAYDETIELIVELNGDNYENTQEIKRFLSISTSLSCEINNQKTRCQKASEVITA